MRTPEDTYDVAAVRERESGRRAYESAKGDAMGELYCAVCGLKRYGRAECPECGAGRDARGEARRDNTGQFPMDLADARRWTETR